MVKRNSLWNTATSYKKGGKIAAAQQLVKDWYPQTAEGKLYDRQLKDAVMKKGGKVKMPKGWHV